MSDVDYGVVLNVGAFADADIVDVPADDCVEPNGRLFAHVHVANHVGAFFNERAWINLGVNTAKGSDHFLRLTNSFTSANESET